MSSLHPEHTEHTIKSTAPSVAQSRPTSSTNPRHDAIVSAAQKTASQILLEASPRKPLRLMRQESASSVDALAEHISVQTATSLTKPSVPPFLATPWAHSLHWSMPPPAVLADIFYPELVVAIRNAYIEHNTLCFCAVVLTTAQLLLRTQSSRNLLRDYPTDMADCLSVMNQIMLVKGVKVFAIECDRIELLYGRTYLDEHIAKRTFAEHMSEFIEQLPRMGYVAYQAADQQLEPEAENVRDSNRLKRRIKQSLRKCCKKLQLKKINYNTRELHG
ncbi:hypothetical protein T440DRAFT_523076 [Plenodomus tracheiphilus IPT5]|uniref:Uncharacterized protein n=1 Tax=Plenodomus tracheiphilus IPT5 TaxID=1408161 RepID=A0A6A7APG8_9PLEO|nr:hypothetical protein T440DRAFT_523076 [Plenodomus tracheiphilus IPT5]